MKRFTLFVLAIFTFLSLLIIPKPASASTNNFYFKDATFDYYLKNTDSGTTMHVKETLVAVFPESDQNHGITRAIPFSNMDGKNITVKSPEDLNLQVTRNGTTEEISRISKDEDEFIVYIGSAYEYVHGEQIYVLEYDFQNVITEFSSQNINVSGEHSADVAYQELYWDTNGTGWSQKFDHLTANLHLTAEQSKALLGNRTSCYVGRYGSNNSTRCSISSDDETTYNPSSITSANAINPPANTSETILTFETSNLSPRENLTFAVDFSPGTFNVPELPKNYILVIITTVTGIICAIAVGLAILAYFKKAHQKKKYYKSLFKAPQYSPPKDLDVAEASILYSKKAKNPYVATLLELAVSGKITILKGEPTKILKKDTWIIQLNDTAGLTNSQLDLLKILSGGTDPSKVENGIIFIEKHTPTAELETISRNYRKDAKKSLEGHGYLESPSIKSNSLKIGTIIAVILVVLFLSVRVFFAIFNKLASNSSYGIVIGAEILPVAITLIIAVAAFTVVALAINTSKFKKYSTKGLDMANYLDGLYLYIKMAEADRIKFLQSTKGADTSPKGIVNLYEKLLPYACLFGLEESWLDALGKYCKEINYSPSWYGDNDFITYYALSSMTRNLNSAVTSSTSYSSSNSGSSSFSSGGGGGGFSGGGGGGGGGGGW